MHGTIEWLKTLKKTLFLPQLCVIFLTMVKVKGNEWVRHSDLHSGKEIVTMRCINL